MSKRQYKYKSDAMAAIHETAAGLHDAGIIGKRIMKAFNEVCLGPAKLSAKS